MMNDIKKQNNIMKFEIKGPAARRWYEAVENG